MVAARAWGGACAGSGPVFYVGLPQPVPPPTIYADWTPEYRISKMVVNKIHATGFAFTAAATDSFDRVGYYGGSATEVPIPGYSCSMQLQVRVRAGRGALMHVGGGGAWLL